jgi:hypothetical protein
MIQPLQKAVCRREHQRQVFGQQVSDGNII